MCPWYRRCIYIAIVWSSFTVYIISITYQSNSGWHANDFDKFIYFEHWHIAASHHHCKETYMYIWQQRILHHINWLTDRNYLSPWVEATITAFQVLWLRDQKRRNIRSVDMNAQSYDCVSNLGPMYLFIHVISFLSTKSILHVRRGSSLKIKNLLYLDPVPGPVLRAKQSSDDFEYRCPPSNNINRRK